MFEAVNTSGVASVIDMLRVIEHMFRTLQRAWLDPRWCLRASWGRLRFGLRLRAQSRVDSNNMRVGVPVRHQV